MSVDVQLLNYSTINGLGKRVGLSTLVVLGKVVINELEKRVGVQGRIQKNQEGGGVTDGYMTTILGLCKVLV